MFLSVFVSTIDLQLTPFPPWPHQALIYTRNKETYVRLLFLDFKSAFNSIIQQKLVSKLAELGNPSSTCNWILGFLTGRPQCVRINNKTSSSLILNTSLPRGCVSTAGWWPLTAEPGTRTTIRRPWRWFWILAGLAQPTPPPFMSIEQLWRSSPLFNI